MKKIILSAVLSLSVLSAAIPLYSVSAKSEIEKVVPAGKEVTFIVNLDSPALLDYAADSNGRYSTVSDLLLSDMGETYTSKIESSQQKVREDLKKKVPDADFSDSLSYNSITNGFTVKADIAYQKVLEGLSGVRSVSVSKETAIPVTKTAEKNDTSDTAVIRPASSVSTDPTGESSKKEVPKYGMASKSTVNVQPAYDQGYTGKGTLIAVIDSEFDVEHKAFSVKPPKARLNKGQVRKINKTGKLNISAEYDINDIYYNGKIIYAYDYGENDNDCYAENYYHGTHVASIAAGNNGNNGEFEYRGMAYDAQLALFKISSKSGQLRNEAIVSALDDAMKFSPDVINCSYGAAQYLSFDYEGRQLYERLTGSGIAVVASAGNSSYNGCDVGVSKIPVEHVNYYTVGKPSNQTDVLSVASVEPEATYAQNIFFLTKDDRKIIARLYPLDLEVEDISDFDSVSSSSSASKSGSGTMRVDKQYDYIYFDTTGDKIDYSSVDTEGKIVVFNLGEKPLEPIIKDVYKHKCHDAIVIRDDAFYKKTYRSNADVSVYMVDPSEKQYFQSHPTGKLTVGIDDAPTEQKNETARFVSDYSSYGTKADLDFKPDISAPGSDVLGAAYNGEYRLMSGTSMSAPCAAGAYAIMKQYANEGGLPDNLSQYNYMETIYKLMMSTANISVYPRDYIDADDDICFSPRLQGAGIIDLGAAINTSGYLSVGGARPKAAMKTTKTNTYNFKFTVKNRSDHNITYNYDYYIQTDGYKKNDDEDPLFTYENTLIPASIKDNAKVSLSVDGVNKRSITVKAGDERTVTATVTLDINYIREHRMIFTNGFYVDGFLMLRASDNNDLSMPFTGFYGDWSKEGIFSEDIYSGGKSFPDRSSSLAIVSLTDGNNNIGLVAGENIFGNKDFPTQIAFGRQSIKSYYRISDITYVSYSVLLPNNYLLREAMDYTVSLWDSDNNLLYNQNFGGISSYYNPSGMPYIEFTEEEKLYMFYSFSQMMETLPEGRYKYGIEACSVGTDGNPEKKESRTYDIVVDNTEPDILTAKLDKTDDGKLYLTVVAKDNNLIQGIALSAVTFDERGKVESSYNLLEEMDEYFGGRDKYMKCSYNEKTGYYFFKYDLTDYKKLLDYLANLEDIVYTDDDVTIRVERQVDYSNINRCTLALEAVDCAYNACDMELINVNNYGEGELKIVDENGDPVRGLKLKRGDKEFVSNSKGIVKLYNLNIGKNTFRITSDNYRLTDGSALISFSLSKDDYRYSGSVIVKKVEPKPVQTSESSDGQKSYPEREHSVTPAPEKKPHSSEGETVVYPTDYSTGENIVWFASSAAAVFVSGLTLTLIVSAKRKKRE